MPFSISGCFSATDGGGFPRKEVFPVDLTLHSPLTALPGVGQARAKALAKLGLSAVGDLLAYFPREYEDRTLRESIAALPLEEPVCFAAVVAEPGAGGDGTHQRPGGGRHRPAGPHLF